MTDKILEQHGRHQLISHKKEIGKVFKTFQTNSNDTIYQNAENVSDELVGKLPDISIKSVRLCENFEDELVGKLPDISIGIFFLN